MKNPLKNPDPLGPTCLRPECDMKARTRGLCDACYRAAQGVMKKFPKITWDKLVARGKCLERVRRPSPATAWLTDWMKPRGRKRKVVR